MVASQARNPPDSWLVILTSADWRAPGVFRSASSSPSPVCGTTVAPANSGSARPSPRKRTSVRLVNSRIYGSMASILQAIRGRPRVDWSTSVTRPKFRWSPWLRRLNTFLRMTRKRSRRANQPSRLRTSALGKSEALSLVQIQRDTVL